MAYNLLKGKKGIIFGALNEQSIAWQAALKAHEEGAQMVLSNTPVAMRLGTIAELGKICNAVIIPADATSTNDIENLLKKSMEIFGGQIDFILHSIGMSPNVRKGLPYDALNYDYFLKTLDISALSFHKILLAARKFDAIKEWGSVVALSYVASQRTLDKYNDMGDAKALLESIARSFGYIYGKDKKIRVNTISQSPTMTTAGSGVKGIDSLIDFTERMSPLGNASAEDCANYIVTLFSDLTKKVTMQNLYHDGGFSSMGMSERAMRQYDKSFNECN
ncbi:MAG: SDR family oxidoreductase [Bacteroidales bacterium]